MQTLSPWFHKQATKGLRSKCSLDFITYSTIQNILKTLVHMFQSNITRINEFQPQEYAQRGAFKQCCVDKMSSDSSSLRWMDFSDECIFHVSELASTRNTCIRGTENATETQQHDLQRGTLTVEYDVTHLRPDRKSIVAAVCCFTVYRSLSHFSPVRLFRIKCFQNWCTADMVQKKNQKNHPT